MVRFTAQFIETKRSEHVFRLCSIFNSRNRKATVPIRSSHYYEIKATWLSRAIGRKGRMRLRAQELSERDRFRYEVLYSRRPFVIEQNPPLNKRYTYSELDKFREIHYRDCPMLLMCINYYIYAEDEKLVCEEARWRHWLGPCNPQVSTVTSTLGNHYIESIYTNIVIKIW